MFAIYRSDCCLLYIMQNGAWAWASTQYRSKACRFSSASNAKKHLNALRNDFKRCGDYEYAVVPID